MTWRSIDTFPKGDEFRSVLGVDEHGEIRTTHWDSYADAFIMDLPYAQLRLKTWTPTHWMPLPAPPLVVKA